jgi:hypothetical protein
MFIFQPLNRFQTPNPRSRAKLAKLDHFGSSRDNGKCAKQLRMKFETYQAAAHLVDK